MTPDEIKGIIGFTTVMVLIVMAFRYFIYEILGGKD